MLLVKTKLDKSRIRGRALAWRDIYPGEELTCDYSLFDAEFAHYSVNYSQQTQDLTPAFAM